jgi:hypothetical protein
LENYILGYGEKRLGNAYAKAGITRTVNELEEEAADIIRNNIPNYDYVGDFIKGLRNYHLVISYLFQQKY